MANAAAFFGNRARNGKAPLKPRMAMGFMLMLIFLMLA